MKKIPVYKIFCSTCLLTITASAVTAVVIYAKNSSFFSDDDHITNYASEVTWDGAYHLGIEGYPDFVVTPNAQNIAAALHEQFSLAFPNTNDFAIQITNDSNAIVTASPYSKIYSGTTNVTWDTEQKLNLPQTVLLSPFYTQGNTMYENEDVTQQMVFDKLVSEYSNSLNINQLLLTQRNDIAGEFTVQPKADSTVYNTSSQLNAQINVTQSAVLTYGKTIVTSGSNSGAPSFKYRGSTVTATYTTSTLTAPITFESNKLVYAANTEYSGGLFVITGSYTTGGNTYTASWTIFCQQYEFSTGINENYEMSAYNIKFAGLYKNSLVVFDNLVLPNYTTFRMNFYSAVGIEYFWGRRSTNNSYSRGWQYYNGAQILKKGFTVSTLADNLKFRIAFFVYENTGDDVCMELAFPTKLVVNNVLKFTVYDTGYTESSIATK